jgi:hypothetical protein
LEPKEIALKSYMKKGLPNIKGEEQLLSHM